MGCVKRVLTWLGWILLVAGVALILLGIWTWPPGGLFFAMPFFFLIPGVPLAVIGGVLLMIGWRMHDRPNDPGRE